MVTSDTLPLLTTVHLLLQAFSRNRGGLVSLPYLYQSIMVCCDSVLFLSELWSYIVLQYPLQLLQYQGQAWWRLQSTEMKAFLRLDFNDGRNNWCHKERKSLNLDEIDWNSVQGSQHPYLLSCHPSSYETNPKGLNFGEKRVFRLCKPYLVTIKQ